MKDIYGDIDIEILAFSKNEKPLEEQ